MRLRAPELARPQVLHAEDLALASRCLTDPVAFEQLYRFYAPQVYGLALRLLGRAADAEDMVQEVFTKVVGAIATYRGEAALSSWLHRITVRACLRAMKRGPKRVREALVLISDEGVERAAHANDAWPLASGGDPERSLSARQRLVLANELLEAITPERRAVFLLHEVEGFSLPETAAFLGISVSAAKKRVWRARRDLEKQLARRPRFQRALAGDEGV